MRAAYCNDLEMPRKYPDLVLCEDCIKAHSATMTTLWLTAQDWRCAVCGRQSEPLVAELLKYEFVTKTNLWERKGHRRVYINVYINTEKANGGKGYDECYVDLETRRLVARGEAGAATRKMLRPIFEQMAKDHGLTLDVK